VAVEGNTVNKSVLLPWTIVVALIASNVVVGMGWGPPANAQPPKRVGPTPRAVARPVAVAPLLPSGRYQLATGRDGNNRSANVLYLVDTATGRVWYARGVAAKDRGVTYRWAEMVPALPAKER
jgi:hypothetical protein